MLKTNILILFTSFGFIFCSNSNQSNEMQNNYDLFHNGNVSIQERIYNCYSDLKGFAKLQYFKNNLENREQAKLLSEEEKEKWRVFFKKKENKLTEEQYKEFKKFKDATYTDESNLGKIINNSYLLLTSFDLKKFNKYLPGDILGIIALYISDEDFKKRREALGRHYFERIKYWSDKTKIQEVQRYYIKNLIPDNLKLFISSEQITNCMLKIINDRNLN